MFHARRRYGQVGQTLQEVRSRYECSVLSVFISTSYHHRSTDAAFVLPASNMYDEALRQAGRRAIPGVPPHCRGRRRKKYCIVRVTEHHARRGRLTYHTRNRERLESGQSRSWDVVSEGDVVSLAISAVTENGIVDLTMCPLATHAEAHV